MRIENWNLAHTVVNCPDDENCGYINYMKECAEDFTDKDMEFVDAEIFTVKCRCAKCGRKFTAYVETVMDFEVDRTDEGDEK